MLLFLTVEFEGCYVNLVYICLKNRKLLECLCAVIETGVTSFQPEKCLVKTRGVTECFLSQYRDTKAIFYVFYKTGKFFQIFVGSSMSLYSNTKWEWRQLSLYTLRENEARPIRVCVRRVLFYKYTYTCLYVNFFGKIFRFLLRVSRCSQSSGSCSNIQWVSVTTYIIYNNSNLKIFPKNCYYLLYHQRYRALFQ